MTFKFTPSGKVELILGRLGGGRGANQTRNVALGCVDRNFTLQNLVTDFMMLSNFNVWAGLTACFEKLRWPPKEF